MLFLKTISWKQRIALFRFFVTTQFYTEMPVALLNKQKQNKQKTPHQTTHFFLFFLLSFFKKRALKIADTKKVIQKGE